MTVWQVRRMSVACQWQVIVRSLAGLWQDSFMSVTRFWLVCGRSDTLLPINLTLLTISNFYIRFIIWLHSCYISKSRRRRRRKTLFKSTYTILHLSQWVLCIFSTSVNKFFFVKFVLYWSSDFYALAKSLQFYMDYNITKKKSWNFIRHTQSIPVYEKHRND